MKITRAEVEMDAILDYVEQLKTLDTESIIPTAHAVPMENAFRPDEIRTGFTTEQALSNAPDASENAFRVRRVIE